ncbi:MAG: DUF5329 domain-containing protein [Pontibacter sp.]|nr:DUF5329 domain-containing protein [Pontibacter sp.]
MKTKKKALVLLGFTMWLGAASAQQATAQASANTVAGHIKKSLTEDQKVYHLIQYVYKMKDATFIRNGSEHTCREAAEHLESKWEKHKDDVKTARGFIKELASSSGLTGEPYMIRFADGTEKTTNEVLTQELMQLEK